MNSRANLIFEQQKKHHPAVKKTTALQRIHKLKTLKESIRKHERQIYDALRKDLGKSSFEAAVTEVILINGEIDFAIKNLKSWMHPKRMGKTLSNPFAKNRIYYEPKGVCLILSPWNYPFQLVMAPLISSIAAGNCTIIKPSELSPATSHIIGKIIGSIFCEEEVSCIEGDKDTATQLLALPFDHIFFTGSTSVGKIVMEAAAKNLSSVTLELGGKSPAIIDSTADLRKAAQKIAWGKLVNCGQTCIAPDYVLIHEQNADEFIGLYKDFVQEMFFMGDEKINPSSYGKIVNKFHFNRLKTLVDQAITEGARIDLGGKFDEKAQVINPVVLRQVAPKSAVMTEEIFGPVLPILTYKDLNEAIDIINQKPKPLALYIFSQSKKNIKDILRSTSSGGACVNDVLIHIANPKLPFGGVNHSGLGSSHGFFGFKSFSHERAVVIQSKIDFSSLVYPPYEGKGRILNLLKRII
ncbi:aldehyde dehydrogenase family protein [Pedobacter montanisoli]|uniref:Aldehyde dehydrogenase n=1 Tax=Pedobacter montanisoli TaxID=2923277 RepID=A0ABS9ZTE2_9SPHI|nr:aldehyde dehydrogenase family protein [Pedobacter montanisoli]MCJ0741783.1 aldehyde dehydrogenase family protein [Pedobacter montanisoli]